MGDMTRRTFGQVTASGLASSATLLAAKKIPIAVQLYSVRQIAQKVTVLHEGRSHEREGECEACECGSVHQGSSVRPGECSYGSCR